MAISEALGLSSRPVRCELDELVKLEMPCILHWDLDHYVVLRKATAKRVEIYDPARGVRDLPTIEVSKHFTGVALELTASPDFQKKPKADKVNISDLWSRLSGFQPVLWQLFFLTLLLQIFGLIMPLANQMVVDDVIGHGDADLLLRVIIGFAIVALIQTAIDLLRNFIQLHASQRLSIKLAGNLLRHMLRLPADYFERRHVGDIASRFGSLDPIQQFLSGGIIGIAMDAIMLVPAGVIMVMYSPLLSLLVVADIVLALGVQWATFGRNRRLANESIALSAKTQSLFLETVRAIRAIKLASRETERHSVWQNAMADVQNLNYRRAVFNLWGSSGFGLLMTAQGLLMLYLGATQIMAGWLTLGMLFAFQAYAVQFSSRAKSLVGQFFTFKMLEVHLERLSDIVHADQEPSLNSGVIQHRPLTGQVELQNVNFRYAPQDPWIFTAASLRIAPGERIALIGPSGGGKSTLLKLMTGLYLPTEGEVLFDGMPMSALGTKALRDQIGVVMQDDQLLSGTIADNVAFFDTQIDMERVESACRTARIHDEILRLPMAYHSLIGDMGSILSGGQRQRVLLARALYRQPRILFMDEGTANLDNALEDAILANLRELGITQIMVAHRQAAIAFAERAYSVEHGKVIEYHPSANDSLPKAAV